MGKPNSVNGQQSTVNGTSPAGKVCRYAKIWLAGLIQAAQVHLVQPHHRSLKAWIEAKEVSRAAFRASRHHWIPAASAIFGQLQRSALSIQLNIAEGCALADVGRFGNHLAIAYGSAVETEELLELAMEEEILPRDFVQQTLAHCRQCERLLLGLLKRYRPLGRSR